MLPECEDSFSSFLENAHLLFTLKVAFLIPWLDLAPLLGGYGIVSFHLLKHLTSL